jgi:hypothetical protein
MHPSGKTYTYEALLSVILIIHSPLQWMMLSSPTVMQIFKWWNKMLSKTQAVGSPCRTSLKKTESTWQLLEVLGHWKSCYPVFTECYLPQRWAKGLVCGKFCYLINFKFQTYGMVTYSQTTQSPTMRHVQEACTHTQYLLECKTRVFP